MTFEQIMAIWGMALVTIGLIAVIIMGFKLMKL